MPPTPATRAIGGSALTAGSVTTLGTTGRESAPLATRTATNPAAAALLIPAATQPVTSAAGAAGSTSWSDPSQRSPSLEAWRAVLARIRAERAPLASILEHASPIAVSAERVVLGYEPGSFLAAQATDASHVELLTRHVREYFGTVTPVAFDLTASPKANPSVASIDIEERKVRLEQARRAVAEHPLVKAAIEILGAELKDVRVTE
jgi:DNA polymerase-3 subunit gamma/tau